MRTFAQLLQDEAGFVVSSELVLLSSVTVAGLLVGATTLRDQVVAEIADVADAISDVNQSYSFSGLIGHSASTAGSVFIDNADFCDTSVQVPATFPHCIAIIPPVDPDAA